MCSIEAVGVSHSRYSVLVVDNNPKTRSRICAAVDADSMLVVWGEAGSIAEASCLLKYGLPAVALVELELPDGRGETIITQLCKYAPYVQTVGMSMSRDIHILSADAKTGASGFLYKSEDIKTIVPGITRVLKNRLPLLSAYNRSVKTVNGQVDASDRPSLSESKAKKTGRSKLTPAEIDILNYVAKGFTGPEIAAITGRSVNTVPVHMKSIYRKLSVSGRGEAVFRALQLGLIGKNHP